MSPISLVLFDMDQVLCTYDRPARCAYLARLAGITAQAVYDAIWQTGFETGADAGAIDAQTYLRGFGDRIGYPLTLDEWLEARRISMTPRPAVLDLVGRVRERARIAVLTNNTTLVADHIDRLLPDLRPLFGDAIHASAEFNAAKPDPVCFLRCVQALGGTPGSTLFVDDLDGNVAGAIEAGLLAHHYVSPEALAERLRYHDLV
jgi:putative hydrolase of the HAD superfamily